MNWFWIGLGGAIGSISRFAIGNWVQQKLNAKLPALLDFPTGTILVNVSGSFLIGLLAFLKKSGGESLLAPSARLFLLIGICGGYTTFSSFSLETLQLADKGSWPKAGWNVLVSVAACLLAVWLGHQLALTLNKARGV
ncbi:MAG: fluoride efflux transporter CrcB [Pedosphaera sp.]|nr:fluoride efflux transporter CrcB [Pedosphaera sp.]